MFPDAESVSLNPPRERSVDEAGRPLVVYRDGSVADQVVNLWPEPISGLMPALGSFGDLIAQQRMAAIAKVSAHDLDHAVRLAREEAAPFLSTGRSCWGYATIYPMLLNEGPRPVLLRAEDLGVPTADLKDAYDALHSGTLTTQRLVEILGRSPEFERALAEPVTIRRAWGAIGLFWALLLEELEGRRSFAECERCGRINFGKRGKRFCGRDDHPACFRARRAIDQRRSRGRDI
jgi:hypothetical protein